MRPSVYIETSVVSYLVANPSNDPVVAGHQHTTREWWGRRDEFDLHISPPVLDEAGAGDRDVAARRIEALAGASVLRLTDPVRELARSLVSRGPLPTRAAIDAFHIAVAAVNGIEYLLTWNCRHIANAAMRPQIERICRESGYEPPIICTPEELLHGGRGME